MKKRSRADNRNKAKLKVGNFSFASSCRYEFAPSTRSPNSPFSRPIPHNSVMANNSSDPPTDDFLEQILGLPAFASTDSGLAGADGGLGGAPPPMMLQLNSGDGAGHLAAVGGGGSGAGFHGAVYQLGLSLEQGKGGFLKPEEASGSGKRFREDVVDGRAKNVR